MLQAVIFDVDGVLLDSFEANLKFFQEDNRQHSHILQNMRMSHIDTH